MEEISKRDIMDFMECENTEFKHNTLSIADLVSVVSDHIVQSPNCNKRVTLTWALAHRLDNVR